MPQVVMANRAPAETPLRRLRLALGLTQVELGAQARVTGSRISQAELGISPLARKPLMRLRRRHRRTMDRLGITLWDLLCGRRERVA